MRDDLELAEELVVISENNDSFEMTEDGDQIVNPDFADPIKKKVPRPVTH